MRHFSTRKALPAISIAVSLCFAALIAVFFNSNMLALLKEREMELIEIHQEQIVDLLRRDESTANAARATAPSTSQSRTMYQADVRATRALSALVFVACCLLSLILIGLTELLLVRPILNLTQKVSGLSYEQFSLELPSLRGRELNTLSLAIRGLLRRVENHRRRIEGQNERLNAQNIMLGVLTNYDAHTNLPNGNMLKAELHERIPAAIGNGRFVTLMYANIVNFRLVHDACGQRVSDQLLVAVAERLRTTFGAAEAADESIVASLGHENFALVATTDDAQEAGTIVGTLMALFAEPFIVEDNEIVVNASVGIAVAPYDGKTFDELHARANIAMYNARNSGESSFLFFDHSQQESAIGKYNRIADIKRGIERGEFRVVFQPKVDLRTNLIASSEALVRWHSEAGVIVPPSAFIPDACETGLIVPLSWEILRQAFEGNIRFAAALGKTFSVGVNVPNNVLLHNDFIPILTGLLEETRMPPSQLNVELTEDVLVSDMERCNERMYELQRMGVQISIDDFGTGYASLQYLSRMPFDWMKIDKTFIDGLPDKPEEMAIIAASVGIARSLGMKIVLEGVETQQQWDKIVDEDYGDQVQGFIVSKPLPEDDFIDFVATWNARGDERSEMCEKRFK